MAAASRNEHADLEMTGTARIVIAAPPELLYDMVSDVTRVGEWSPHTVAGRWLDDPQPRVGARFAGDNVGADARWTMNSTVTVATRPREFGFVTEKAEGPTTHWRYRFEAVDAGTRVTESFEWKWMASRGGFRAQVGEQPIDVARTMVADRRDYLIASMETTLANLKRVAEGGRP